MNNYYQPREPSPTVLQEEMDECLQDASTSVRTAILSLLDADEAWTDLYGPGASGTKQGKAIGAAIEALTVAQGLLA